MNQIIDLLGLTRSKNWFKLIFMMTKISDQLGIVKENGRFKGNLTINGIQGIPSEERKKFIAKVIRATVALHGQKMAKWARDLRVHRTAIYHVIAGRYTSKRIRAYIEHKLQQKIWTI